MTISTITESECLDLLHIIGEVRDSGLCKIDSDDYPEFFQNRDTLIIAIRELNEVFREACEFLSNDAAFNKIVNHDGFKAFERKAFRFWDMQRLSPIDDVAAFIADSILSNRAPRKLLFNKRKPYMTARWNFASFRYPNGIPLEVVLDIAEELASQRIEKTITSTEAKAAARYIQQHQKKLIEQREVLESYMLQSGYATTSGVGSTSDFNNTSDALLNHILHERVYSTANVDAKRFVLGGLANNSYVRWKAPREAIAELLVLIDPDLLISRDTVDRWLKNQKAQPRYFPRNRKLRDRLREKYTTADSTEKTA